MADVVTSPTKIPVVSVEEEETNEQQQQEEQYEVPNVADDDGDDDDDSPTSTNEESKSEAPRKTWATISNSTASQDKSTGDNQKVSLLSIMAEEEEKTKVDKEKKRDEDIMNQAIQRSLKISKEDEELQMALRLSMAMKTSDEHQKLPVAMKKAPPSSLEEDDDLRLALRLSMTESTSSSKAPPVAAAASEPIINGAISAEEMKSIELAIQKAEEEEAQKSLQLVMQLEMENDNMRKQSASRVQQQGNVRTITREEYQLEQLGLLVKKDHGDMYSDDLQMTDSTGFRMNSQGQPQQWTRVDGSTILGPNNELRTKHDPELQSQANAHRLQLDFEEDGKPAARVGNKAFNSFQQKIKKKTVKGVASHGQGRANTDAEKTKEGAMDGRVRLLVGKAINNGLMDKLNGCVKEGKEALVYHAEQGSESGGYDVAVKVFKRMQEFRNRGQYVDGDPRYKGHDFSHSSGREQLEIWAEKEYRNLLRAHRAGVPVPKPIQQKENVLFMRFLGQDGWPSPQLREIKMKKGSRKWTALYEQIMTAIHTLYNESKLIHGDLSEYNILVCPRQLLLNGNEEDPQEKDELQIALIDFGQAVDIRHPDADDLLRRDLLRIEEFFEKVGISTIDVEAATYYIQTKGASLR
jgi:serine/threonine-protein kinase RIO1